MSILIRNCHLLNPRRTNGRTTPRDLWIEDTTIQSIETSDRDVRDPSADTVLDGSGMLVVPGFISAHSHSPENLLKATTERLPLESWLIHLFGSCGELSAREMHLSVLLGCAEMLKTGTTGVLDHLWFSPDLDREKLDAAMEAYEQSGMRTAVAPLVEDADYVIEESRKRGYSLHETIYGRRNQMSMSVDEQLGFLDDFFQKWHGFDGGRIQCGVGPSGFQWCTEEFLRETARLSRTYEGLFHVHAMETRLQALICRKYFDTPILETLAEQGLLDEKVSLAHGVWLQEQDIQILNQTGASVVHNPASNLKLGSGRAPVVSLLQQGVNVAIGADGPASNDNQNMFESTKLVSLIHSLNREDPANWPSSREVYEMATLGGARVIGGPDGLGTLQEGAPADLVLLDMNSPLYTPLNDALKHVVFCETGASVDTVIVNGSITVQDGELLTMDLDDLLEEVRERFGGRTTDWLEPVPDLQETMNEMNEFRREFLDQHGGNGLDIPK